MQHDRLLRGALGGGGGGGTQYRNTVKKNWQIPKNRVENRRNTDTAFMMGYLKLYPSRVIVHVKHACITNQPQTLRESIRRPGHWMPFQFHRLCNHLP